MSWSELIPIMFTIPHHVLYSVEEILVTAHVIWSPRQDIQQLLFKRLIVA
ncbi:hypothetical protein C6O39_22510 [Salmonella enterica]|nr:hypothetical protein [Salmonella enterica]EDQ6751890.1 hypothetical protein [Salmonella enterica subsp. enterica serovar O rough]EDQ7945110.1 hypothetical protein [Salmonella enterica subsp. diarizonae]EEH1955913.1 hypothetical protein [Salmonella enterica subsp. diarizonae serovar 61:k:1,5,(7)]HAE6893561.1 hypothetical protein [Salmonella enterica subsp. diarizonae serovar 61:k:1,5,7]